MTEDDDRTARITSAASLLLKGGTLSDKPCPKCQGVQVIFRDKTICVNCGSEVKMANTNHETPHVEEEKNEPIQQASSSLVAAATNIEEKIAIVALDIRNENDFFMQKQKAELLECYLKILENIKNLIS